jgi:hypothetical protein
MGFASSATIGRLLFISFYFRLSNTDGKYFHGFLKKKLLSDGQRAVPRDGEKCKKSAQDQDRLVLSDAPKLLDFARLYLYYEYLRFMSLDFSLRCCGDQG